MRHAAVTLLLALAVATDGVAGDSPRAIDAIENDLVADDPAVRAKAATELTDRFPDGAVAVPMLVDLLDDESPDVVAAAAKAIDSMAVAGAGPLMAWCADKSRMGPKSPFARTIDESYGQSMSAAQLMCPAAGNTTGLPEASAVAAAPFVELDGGTRRQVLGAFAALVRRAPPDLKTLVAAVPTSLAADLLVQRNLGPFENPLRTEQVAAALVLLRTKGDLRTLVGARILTQLRSSDPVVATALAALCVADTEYGTPERRLPDQALSALTAMGTSASAVAPRLIPSLRAPSVSLNLVWALVAMGKARDVEAVLARRPADALTIAKGLLHSPSSVSVAIPFLIDAAKERSSAAWWLGLLGPAGAPALPALRERLARPPLPRFPDDGTTRKRQRIDYAVAILAIEPHDADAILCLEDLAGIESDDHWPASEAASRLASNGVVTPLVVSRVSASLVYATDPDKMFDLSVTIDDITRSGPAAKPLVGNLATLGLAAEHDLASVKPPIYRHLDLRRPVAVALGRVGPDAQSATALLEDWKTKGDETIRVAAAQALRRIQATK